MSTIKALEITADVTIRFDVEAYALSYGLDLSEVQQDALGHLTIIATDAVREAIERLGLGDTDVRLQGSRVNVAEYKEEEQQVVWEPTTTDPLNDGNVRACLNDGSTITVAFLGDVWSWTLRDVHGEEVAGNWVDTKADAQQAALAKAAEVSVR